MFSTPSSVAVERPVHASGPDNTASLAPCAIKRPSSAATAVAKLVGGAVLSICGFALVCFFGIILGPLVAIPVVAFLALTAVGGLRAARSQKTGWAIDLCAVLFTGAIPGFLGIAGAGLFLQGFAYFLPELTHPDGGSVTPSSPPIHRLAIWSFCLGLSSILLSIISGIPAIVCGHKSLASIRTTNARGRGLAIAG